MTVRSIHTHCENLAQSVNATKSFIYISKQSNIHLNKKLKENQFRK